MAAQKDKTCAEQIGAHLQGRLDDFGAIARVYESNYTELEHCANKDTCDSGRPCSCACDDCLSYTEDDLSEVLNIYDSKEARKEATRMTRDDLSERAMGRLHELPLCVEAKRIVCVTLSTGGPHDEFQFTINDGEIERIDYVFKDWFDSARKALEYDDFETVKRAAEISGWCEVYNE